ncbi:MAG: PAS domain-containing protein [Gammaproteobacteria bacterium]|nr:PAS domain-containing protein [Gammaproteobacteria bacterium]
MSEIHFPKTLADKAEQIFNAVPLGVCILASNESIEWMNPALGQQLGVDADQLIGKQLSELPLRRDQATTGAVETLLVPSSNPTLRLRVTTSAVGDKAKVAIFQDVTELADVSERTFDLGELARTDLTTGLLTRKTIFRELTREVSRSRRYGNHLTAVLLRMQGHSPSSVGDKHRDEMLGQVGAKIADNLRWVDFAGIWDDDQILLVLPETSIEKARELTTKLEQALASISTEGIDGDKLRVSFGVVEWHEDDDAQALLERVQQAST